MGPGIRSCRFNFSLDFEDVTSGRAPAVAMTAESSAKVADSADEQKTSMNRPSRQLPCHQVALVCLVSAIPPAHLLFSAKTRPHEAEIAVYHVGEYLAKARGNSTRICVDRPQQYFRRLTSNTCRCFA